MKMWVGLFHIWCWLSDQRPRLRPPQKVAKKGAFIKGLFLFDVRICLCLHLKTPQPSPLTTFNENLYWVFCCPSHYKPKTRRGKKKRCRNHSPTLRQLGLPSHPHSLPHLLSGSLNSPYWFLTQHIPNHLKVWPPTPWGWWQMPGKPQMEMLWVRGDGMVTRALDDSISPVTLKTLPPPVTLSPSLAGFLPSVDLGLPLLIAPLGNKIMIAGKSTRSSSPLGIRSDKSFNRLPRNLVCRP